MTFIEETPASPSPVNTENSSEVKLIDQINNYHQENGKPFYSLEFFPPRKESELTSFWPLCDQLRQGNPLFMDITWHSRAPMDPKDELSSLAVAGWMVKKYKQSTVLHITCFDYDASSLELILDSAKSLGIRNILALRGDRPVSKEIESDLKHGTDDKPVKVDQEKEPGLSTGNQSIDKTSDHSTPTLTIHSPLTSVPSVSTEHPTSTTTTTAVTSKIETGSSDRNDPESTSKFSSALDFVKFVRLKYQDYFTIGVAGYPMGHPEAKSYSEDLDYLKAKIDAGADFIVTQLSFTADQYITFIKDCLRIGIKAPIIPGIFPIQTQASIRNITKLTQIEPPAEMRATIESLKGDPSALHEFGTSHTVDLCRKLLVSEVPIPGFHFYTLNRDNCVTDILKRLNLWNPRIELRDAETQTGLTG